MRLTDHRLFDGFITASRVYNMKNQGNPKKIAEVLRRASAGESVCIGFIGGSITQGAAATDDSGCYAALVYKWLREHFSASKVKYVNAGIGATTSQFGAARAEDDLLKYDPDLIVVEYSVNDNDELPNDRREFFKETYEGLIRRLLRHINGNGRHPAILIVHSVRYDDGSNEEEIHSMVGAHYGIPCISMKELVYDKIRENREGLGKVGDITADMLHPNDLGHRIVAKQITDHLETISGSNADPVCGVGTIQETSPEPAAIREELPSPLTDNSYENAVRYNNLNSGPVCDGFVPDTAPVTAPLMIGETTVYASEVRDVFKGGWTASKKGASITFTLTGSEIAVMYKKSVKKPAPIACAVIDGDTKNRVKLDANFNEDWGDKAYMATILHHGIISDGSENDREHAPACKKDNSVHTLTITIEEEGGASDFYLINVICAGTGE